MPDPAPALPPWLIPHMHTPFRFIDGLAEDMLGYIFPAGNAVGIPTASNLNPSDTDRFGCGHSDDSEVGLGPRGGHHRRRAGRRPRRPRRPPELIVTGRYVLPGGQRSRDPLGGPEIKCTADHDVPLRRARGRASRWPAASVVHPRLWMSLSGLPQRRPDRDTRGYIDARGRRVWLNVF